MASRKFQHPGRRMIAVTAFSVAAIALGGSWIWFRYSAPPAPPTVNLDGVDFAVVASINDARQHVESSPRSSEAWGRLGATLLVNEFNDEASFCLEQAQQRDRHEPRWPYLRAIAIQTEHPEQALPDLSRAVELCGNTPVAPRIRLANLLLQLGRLDDAAVQFDRIGIADPSNPYAPLGLGKIEMARNQLDVAAAHFNRALTDPATQKQAELLLAQVHERLGKHEAAQRESQAAAALPIDPGMPDLFFEEAATLRTGKDADLWRSDSLLRRGETDKAIALLRKTVVAYPKSDDAWRKLGEALLNARDFPAAEQAMRKAVDLNPRFAELHNHLGVTLLQQDRVEEAALCFRESIDLKPHYPQAHYNFGLCLRRQQHLGSAEMEFRDAVRFKPDFADAWAFLGNVLAREGKVDEARKVLEEAIRLRPDDAMSHRFLKELKSGANP